MHTSSTENQPSSTNKMHHNPSHYFFLIVYATLLLVAQSNGRELRPSDHGLYYEEDSLPPAQSNAAMEMRSFFGKTTSSYVPLPEAKDIGDTWWNVHNDGKSHDIKKMDHVKVGLMVASLVCGLIGIVLLVVSGVVFLFRLQKKSGGKVERLAAMSGSGSEANYEVNGDKK